MSLLVVALDVPTGEEALRLADALHPHVDGFKVGLELLMGEGPTIVSRVAALGAPVFVDAKLHDIPNTVAGAASRLGSIGARWVTVHASGGRGDDADSGRSARLELRRSMPGSWLSPSSPL